MCEFLYYNKEHWMDSMPQVRFDELLARDGQNWLNKYNARNQRGDIIECRPDGFWTDGKRTGFGSHAFGLLCVPKMSVKQGMQYTGMHEIDGQLVKKCKFSVKTTEITPDAKGIATISKLEASTKIEDKSTAVIIG